MSAMIGNPLLLPTEGYEISRSVRLRSSASASFTRTMSASGTTDTWSIWCKRGKLGATQALFDYSNASTTSFGVEFTSGDALTFYDYSSAFRMNLVTTQVFRDPSAWYHIVCVLDTTQATTSNRAKIYVNGQQVTSFSTATYPTQNASLNIASSLAFGLGVTGGFTSQYLDGYLTEVNFIDGQALTPSSFGETDAITGVWKPKKYTGTYGTNGFYLNFSDNSAATAAAIGKDYSGNGNNWTPNNISVTAGVTYDSMLDVPTLWADGGNGRGNYCVLNAAIRPYPVADNIADGNLKFTSSSASVGGSVWGTIPMTTGKWYAECTVTTASASSSDFIGVSSDLNFAALGTYSAALRDYGYTYKANGNKCNNSATGTAYGASYTSGDVIGVALDAGAGTIEFFKNGASQGSAYTGMTYNGGFLFGSTAFNGGVHNWNFGQRPFSYTPPTGFKALNTQNLPEPTIKKGNAYFDVSLYSGNSSTQSITNSGAMQPDLVWGKARSAAGYDHFLYDSVRGTTKWLGSSSTSAEQTISGVTAFNSNGFTLGSDANSNQTGNTYVGWQWKEGATQGFDIVTYTGTGAASQVVNHSLGVAPNFVIVKNRSASASWNVWGSQGFTRLGLNITNGDLGNFPITRGSSSITLPSTSDVGWNSNGNTYVAYLFSEVAGFSKFGSYTGNGSADGPMIFTGFRPAFIMIKRTDTTGNWTIHDNRRSGYNGSSASKELYPNLSNAEGSDSMDQLSNGFKLRDTYSDVNASGGTYIFMALAESPFRNSLAR